MNIPFPIIFPSMIGDWFNADKPYDDDEELTRLEQENKRWLNSIGQKYMKPVPQEKPAPERVEEAETDDDVFIVNDDTGESEESHDVDEEEEMPAAEVPPENTEMELEAPERVPDTPEEEEEEEEEEEVVEERDERANNWPYVPQDQ